VCLSDDLNHEESLHFPGALTDSVADEDLFGSPFYTTVMSSTPTEDGAKESADSDDPIVPEGVLRGIEDIEAGNTASKEELESLLNF